MKSVKTLIFFLLIASSLVITPLLAPQRASSIGPIAQPVAVVNQDDPLVRAIGAEVLYSGPSSKPEAEQTLGAGHRELGELLDASETP